MVVHSFHIDRHFNWCHKEVVKVYSSSVWVRSRHTARTCHQSIPGHTNNTFTHTFTSLFPNCPFLLTVGENWGCDCTHHWTTMTGCTRWILDSRSRISSKYDLPTLFSSWFVFSSWHKQQRYLFAISSYIESRFGRAVSGRLREPCPAPACPHSFIPGSTTACCNAFSPLLSRLHVYSPPASSALFIRLSGPPGTQLAVTEVTECSGAGWRHVAAKPHRHASGPERRQSEERTGCIYSLSSPVASL